MNSEETSENEIIVKEDVDAIVIPGGEDTMIPKGTRCFIAQRLGGTYTLATDYGLVRVTEKNAHKLGMEDIEKKSDPVLEKAQEMADKGDVQGAIWEQLKQVFDPEIPVNIVDLGLVYDCKLEDTEENKKTALIKMTLTAPGCGMGPVIAADAESKVKQIGGIDDAKVELVWDPPWNQDMLSEVGKMKLGLI